MDFKGKQYYKINKILLINLGLWPSQATKGTHIRTILFCTLFFSFLLAQLCTFITSKYDMELSLDVFSHFLPVFLYTMKYSFYYLNAKKIKLLIDRIQYDWNTLNDKREIEIVEKYASAMDVCTIISISVVCLTLTAFTLMEFFPIIFDIIMPLNESRPRHLHVLVEYFVDQDKYFPLMLSHELLAWFAGTVTIAATGTISLIFVQHVCVMLKIVSFRIEHLLEKNILRYSRSQSERIIRDRIIRIVDLHQRALMFHDILMSSFAAAFFILIVIGVACLTLNLYRLLQPSTLTNPTRLFTSLILVIGILTYMFVANYVGQMITDHSVDIFNVTCKILWYIAPLSSQKILLFLMHRTIKNLKPNVYNIFDASLEGFATLSTTSLSYMTVLYSLQSQ